MQQLDFQARLDEIKKPKKRLAAHEWQDRASQVAKHLEAPRNKVSQIMRAFKINRTTKAESTIRYMQDKGIKNTNYFLKSVQ